jgi:hypothetical protein
MESQSAERGARALKAGSTAARKEIIGRKA